MKNNLTEAKIREIFKKKGIKFSKPRYEIYKFILENRTHPTAEDVYNAIKDRIPGISFATAYNVLNKFVEKGLVKQLIIGSSKRFDGYTQPHIHFVCKKCGKIEDVEFQEFGSIANKVKEKGWELKETSLYVFGICPECRKKQKTSNLKNISH